MQMTISKAASLFSRLPRQRQRPAQITDYFRSDWRNRWALIALGFFSGAFSLFSPVASHDAYRGALSADPRIAAAVFFGGLAAPVTAKPLLAKTLPTAQRRSKGTASSGGEHVPVAYFTQNLPAEHPLTAIVHLENGAAEQAAASAAQRAKASTPETLLSCAYRTASAGASSGNSIPPPSRILPHNPRISLHPVESPAFVQQEGAHRQKQAAGKGIPECSCDFAGKCLPKGECVAVACIFVTFAVIMVLFLFWFLQWLSAIPAEWIMAKRFRRRTSRGVLAAAERTPVLEKGASDSTVTAMVERADKQPQVGRERGDDSRSTLISREQLPASVALSHFGHTGGGEFNGNLATAASANENGRL